MYGVYADPVGHTSRREGQGERAKLDVAQPQPRLARAAVQMAAVVIRVG